MSSFLQGPALGAIKGVVSASTRLGASRRVLILILHRVLHEPDPLFPGVMHARRFRVLMEALARVFRPLPLGEAVAALQAGSLPERAVCLTFDDGYADNASVALPILLDLGIHATFFIATGYLNGGVMFSDSIVEAVRQARGDRLDLDALGLGKHDVSSAAKRVSAISDLQDRIKSRPHGEREEATRRLLNSLRTTPPRGLMMSDEEVKELVAKGMAVGGHTHNHPILRSLDDGQAREEVMAGKHYLENLTQSEVTLFAYPNGKPGIDYDARHPALLRECGFKAAVSTAWGVAGNESSVMELPRFMPWDRTPAGFAARIARGLVTGRLR